MKFFQPAADIFVPDGLSPLVALAQVTHLCIAAHQDDIEIMAHAGIVDCLETPGKWFGGVVVTDGAGSPRSGVYANYIDEQMKEVRRDEQRRAAKRGRYGIQIQLAHPSALVKSSKEAEPVRSDLATILNGCKAEVIYLHNPADKHDTHIGVLLRSLEVLRAMPAERRPVRVLGCEVWRDLDWLLDDDKVALDSGRRPGLAAEMLKEFDSQIAGGKRYDLATVGRRLANATFHTSHATDRLEGITWTMDLTPLVNDPKLSVRDYTLGYVDRLRADVAARIEKMS
ncbi:MAG: PIG-L family deacetylase [Nibricoccus sp.]